MDPHRANLGDNRFLAPSEVHKWVVSLAPLEGAGWDGPVVVAFVEE